MRVSRLKLKGKKGQKRSRISFSSAFFFLAQHRFFRRSLVSGFVALVLGLTWIFNGFEYLYTKTSDIFIASTHSYGYKLSDIIITGRKHTSPQDVLRLINNHHGGPVFKDSVSEIQQRLTSEISWIKKADVRRILPNQLIIEIEERTPIALWQHQKKFYLIDGEGIVIGPQVPGFETLPVVVGQDAPQYAPKILSLLDSYPEVKKRLSALVRVQMRRFDIMLHGKMTIKLPEVQIESALSRLNFLLEARKINLDEVTMIDLRLPKQLIVKVSEKAAKRLKLKTDNV